MIEINQILDLFIAIYIGIMGLFFNKFCIKITTKFFIFLYIMTHFSLFKYMAEEATKSYMNILFFIGGILGFVLAGCFIAQSIFGINLPITWK